MQIIKDRQIYKNVFDTLLTKILKMERSHKHRFKNPLDGIDVTPIDLCFSVFPWAKFGKTKSGIKLNVKLDHSGHIPTFVSVTTANTHEVHSVKKMDFQKGDVLTFDKGYTDFKQFANYCNTGFTSVPDLERMQITK